MPNAKTHGVKSIATLKRGLAALDLVRRNDGLSLHQLHLLTATPKASLLRILKTLEESGWIHRRMGDGLYISTETQARGLAFRAPRKDANDVAASVLHELKRHMPWPSDLAVRSGARMMVVQSNRHLYGEQWKRSVIGAQPDMLGSAMGRAYLAFCPDNERNELMGQLIDPQSPLARRREWLINLLKEVKAHGYAKRDPFYAGPDADHDTHLSAIAVPVFVKDCVAACLSCVWQVTGTSETVVAAKWLRVLKEAASRISTQLAESENYGEHLPRVQPLSRI